MKPICTACQRFYRMKELGFCFVEGMPDGGSPRAIPGTAEPDRWKPYKAWSGDLWECLGCGHQIIVGCGQQPIAEHFEPDFAEIVKKLRVTLQVNDC